MSVSNSRSGPPAKNKNGRICGVLWRHFLIVLDNTLPFTISFQTDAHVQTMAVVTLISPLQLCHTQTPKQFHKPVVTCWLFRKNTWFNTQHKAGAAREKMQFTKVQCHDIFIYRIYHDIFMYRICHDVYGIYHEMFIYEISHDVFIYRMSWCIYLYTEYIMIYLCIKCVMIYKSFWHSFISSPLCGPKFVYCNTSIIL